MKKRNNKPLVNVGENKRQTARLRSVNATVLSSIVCLVFF